MHGEPHEQQAPAVTQMAVDMRLRWVRTHPGLTPLGARELNCLAVTRLLESSGIDHFAVSGQDDRASAIGVPVRDKAAVLALLQRELAASRGYLARPGAGLSAGARTVVEPGDQGGWRAVCRGDVVRVVWFRTVPGQTLVHGAESGCDVEFWKEGDQEEGAAPSGAGTDAQPGAEVLLAPRPNRAADRVDTALEPVVLAGERFTRLAGERRVLRPRRSRPEFDVRLPDEMPFPIDLVYTWVDGQDPQWQERRAAADGSSYHADGASAARYISRDELKYSLRSVYLFLPWVRRIFIVTDRQTPVWFDDQAGHDGRVRIVDHREIFADPAHLPTFNSHAIESQLHRIPGLAEHFLYFNDDMFIGRPLPPHAFFHPNGLTKFFPSPAKVPFGDPTPDDPPTSVAAKNNRRLIERTYGRTLVSKMKHVPYALRRSLLAALEREFEEEHARTAASRLRSLTDISIASSLYQHYAYHGAAALPADLRYRYVQLDDAAVGQELQRLLHRRDQDAFCINDSASEPAEIAGQSRLLNAFLGAYFPVPSPYEKPSAP
ncbi:stealth family protein [Streptomyces sp. IBSNAI002]|uniref:stealth family protein n=1 Tax=Streptomyces sp. IBSNAI002 TaxID=3457500 RepID=UPI003FD100FE